MCWSVDESFEDKKMNPELSNTHEAIRSLQTSLSIFREAQLIVDNLPVTQDLVKKIPGSQDENLGYAWLIVDKRPVKLQVKSFNNQAGVMYNGKVASLSDCFGTLEAAEKYVREELNKKTIGDLKTGEFFLYEDDIYILFNDDHKSYLNACAIRLKDRVTCNFCDYEKVLPVEVNFEVKK
jgi:hypothetical protein